MSRTKLYQTIASKLTPNMLFGVIIFCLVLFSGTLVYVIQSKTNIDVFGWKISSTESPDFVRLYIIFDENINIKDPSLEVFGYVRPLEGEPELIPFFRRGSDVGSMYVDIKIKQNDTVFFKIIKDGKIWLTDDFSISQSHISAYSLDD